MTDIQSLREKIKSNDAGDATGVAEEDLLRANFYGLLTSALLAPPSAEILVIFKGLDGDESPLGMAMSSLGELARTTKPEDIEDEFTRLFYGHGAGGELHPYASFYLTGFIYDKPLAQLREELRGLGLSRSGVTSEPEDHIAFLMNVMHELIVGVQGAAMSLNAQNTFFDKHIAPWAPKFFEDLEMAENAEFFRPVGTIGRVLMEIEHEAFTIAA